MKFLEKYTPVILITIAIVVGLAVLMDPPTNSDLTSGNTNHYMAHYHMVD